MARFAHWIAPAMIALAMVVPTLAQDAPPTTTVPAADGVDLATDMQKASYAIGLNIGGDMKSKGVEIDVKALSAGLTDALGGVEPKLTPEQMQQAFTVFQQQMQAKHAKLMQEEGAKNIEAGKAYQAENGKKEGVTTTASGLQYEVLKAGEGPNPAPTDNVTVHYTGSLLDGTVFDSSVKRGEPASFSLDGVVPGWSEGVQLMNKGAKFRFVIPSDLAYGEQGAPRAGIGPNATLIFEVELLDVKKPE